MATDARTAYSVAEFRDPSAEIARLKVQAHVIEAAEDAALCDLGMPESGVLLDFGCGPGFSADRLRRTRPNLTVVGLDRDGGLLAGARRYLSVVRADATCVPFVSAAFDAVFARIVFRHLTQPEVALVELYRVVRPGGILIVLDVDEGTLILHPEPSGFARVRAARVATILRRGADPSFARRLPATMRGAGFTDIRARFSTVSSVEIGNQTFASMILAPYGEAIDADLFAPVELNEFASDLQLWASRGDVFGMVTGSIVAGRRPITGDGH